MRKSWSMMAAMMTAVAMFATMAYGGGSPPTGEECEKEFEKVEKFFDENKDADEEMAKKHAGLKERLEKAFESEDVNWDDIHKQLEAMYAEGLEMAGADVKCAPVLAEFQVKEIKELAELLSELDLDSDSDFDAECEKELHKVEKFFDGNADKYEELENKHGNIDEIIWDALEKAFEGEEVDWDALGKRLAAFFADAFKMAGANVKCAPALAESQVKEMQEEAQEWIYDEDWDDEDEMVEEYEPGALLIAACEEELEKVYKFFNENEDKEEELAKKHTGLDELLDKAFEGEDGNWDDLEKQMTALLADGLEMAGADVKCAPVIAESQVKEIKDMAAMFGDLDIDFDDEDWDEDEE